MSSQERKINNLLDRIRQENNNGQIQPSPGQIASPVKSPPGFRAARPGLSLENLNTKRNSNMRRPQDLTFTPKVKANDYLETEEKLREIMRISGDIKINCVTYKTDIKDMDHLEELGNGTCGHVIKMRHRPSEEIIAVKQMRRSGNSEESKRIIMDIEVVLKSHDCKYIVKCLGCFITEPEVWICMELMSTCFDKLLKRLKHPIPENVLGKVTVATVEALSYLKDKHGVIHRDVKPSNILLDTRGNVKLCDFGISGRLVDSMAKTRSAGCAAYMAPERIEPDPKSPDYDIRADVWSLGITLVELATGVFPYKDCHSDFEVLTKVIENDPPTLPADKDFSVEFRNFVSCCLIKEKKQRPKYVQLKNEPFIKKYETAAVDVGEWYREAIEQADALANKVSPRLNPVRRPEIPERLHPSPKLTNGSSDPVCPPNESVAMPESYLSKPLPPDIRSQHNSRLSTFHSSNFNNQRNSHSPCPHQSSADEYGVPERSSLGLKRNYSPFRVDTSRFEGPNSYQTLAGHQGGYDNNLQQGRYNSPVLQRRIPDVPSGLTSPYLHRRQTPERWKSPGGSPLPLRNHIQNNQEQVYNHENTSPIVLQRFYHQQKQQQQQKEAEEASRLDFGRSLSGQRRFASYFKWQLKGDDSGKSSRNQSPEPPPRLNRSISNEQSPLALRRMYEGNNSPSLSRRHISPTPPVPPPRRLAESASVPGSPQHLRTQFKYTPEPQRRYFPSSDKS